MTLSLAPENAHGPNAMSAMPPGKGLRSQILARALIPPIG